MNYTLSVQFTVKSYENQSILNHSIESLFSRVYNPLHYVFKNRKFHYQIEKEKREKYTYVLYLRFVLFGLYSIL